MKGAQNVHLIYKKLYLSVCACLSVLCFLCTATVLNGSARNLAHGILIPYRLSWGLASTPHAVNSLVQMVASSVGKFGSSKTSTAGRKISVGVRYNGLSTIRKCINQVS